MADTEENKIPAKPKKTGSKLVGSQVKSTVLDDTNIIDIDTKKKIVDNIIETGITGGLNTAAIESFTTISNNRDELYQCVDTMARDASVSSIIRTYAEDVCEMADNGHIVWCESNDSKISKFVNYLLNVMNVDKHIYQWAYALVKYGDVYLRLFRDSDYEDPFFKYDKIKDTKSARNSLNEDYNSNAELNEQIKLNIHKSSDQYSYYAEMIPDPNTMFELVKYGETYGYIEVPNAAVDGVLYQEAVGGVDNYGLSNFRLKSGDVNIYQADDFVHACLEDNSTRFPEQVELFINTEDYNNNTNAHMYNVRRGRSMLIDSYKVWREKTLLEDSVLLSRVTRSSIVKKVQVEVGDMSKEKVKQTLKYVKEMFESKTAFNKDKSMTDYNNPGPLENIVYFATHNGQGAVTIESDGGDVNVKDLADLDNWVNKFYAAYGVPKAYFGYCDDAAGFNGGTSLSIISSVYAKGVKRVQNALIQMITDAINLFLLNKGCRSYLNNFVIKMRAPLTQEERDYRTNLSDKISALSNMNSLLTDVEDKTRKLEIIKVLVRTLSYGDDLIEILDEEIKATKEAEKRAAEEADAEAKAAAEAEAQANAGAAAAVKTEPETVEEPAESEDLDLGNSSAAPIEGLEVSTSTILTEDSDGIITTNDLPMPEDLNCDIDFAENN